ncbi:MAG: hypothetical protein UW80_C0031G0002 [Microgenomates group bacterium GW2011_GWC1_44_9]|nr:MAG: hypothetical protein UW80_C0031G0002 [Microgenomates group bacterium GW2011_GWC1_44_9]
MFSKQILIPIGLFILIGGSTAYMFAKRSPDIKKPSALLSPMATPTQIPTKLLTWTDEAGFSFQYPEGTTIDKHPEDTKNYANLTLTLPSKEEIEIVMSDNKFNNLDAWVSKNSALDTTLDGRPAKKIMLDDLETLACIDNEVIVTITGKDIAEIVKSWTFIYPTPAAASKTSAPSADDGGDVLEEE